jgi:hypothetical protein
MLNKIKYIKGYVSLEEKREWNRKGYRVVSDKFNPNPKEEEKPKPKKHKVVKKSEE